MPSRIDSFGVTQGLVWVTSTGIYRQGRHSDLIALGRTDGVERCKISFGDNMYGLAVFANGHVLVNQGGSFGGPDPQRLRSYGLTPPSPIITSRMVPVARLGTPYAVTLTAAGGAAPLTWTITSGTLPAGLSLAASGVLSGTPTVTAAVRVQVRVTDARGRSQTKPLYVQVLGTTTDAWAGRGADPSRDGWNEGERTLGTSVAPQLAYRWKTAVPAGTAQYTESTRQPAVVGTRLYDVNRDGTLSAWETAGSSTNRVPVWTRAAGGTDLFYPDAPTESGGVLYLEDTAGFLDAIRASDGVRLWRRELGSQGDQRSDLLVQGTKVLVHDYGLGGDVVAYNTADGTTAWGGASVDLSGNYGGSSHLLASDGTRAFAIDDCEVVAITVATGAVAWRVPVKAGGSTNCGVSDSVAPLVADGAVFAQTYDGSIAVEAATGAVRWRSGTRAGYNESSGVIADGVWVIPNGDYTDGNLAALDLATGEVLWQAADAGSLMTFAVGGDLIVGRSTYEFAGYNLLTGEKVWDGGTPDSTLETRGGATIAGGRIYVSTQDGTKAYGLP